MPKVIISNRGTHFYNKLVEALFRKYNITHNVSTSYHPQTRGQAEVSNKEVKSILQKIVNSNRKCWSLRLDDSLWTYKTALKCLLVCQLTGWYMVSVVQILLNSQVHESIVE